MSMTDSQKDAAAKLMGGEADTWETLSSDKREQIEKWHESHNTSEARMEQIEKQTVTVQLTMGELYLLTVLTGTCEELGENSKEGRVKLFSRFEILIEEHIPNADDREMFEEMYL